ncbi:hypothetical protein E3P99_00776 [Wallemia hederae]|uniref:K Homology domain-containing protein n=1 Tax=Wallemia hederae TaxID=1540922 RepID=A0A4V4LTX8_9BASI|nr:hypothetical protein E3P99_00776 [Wallemia hederae]
MSTEYRHDRDDRDDRDGRYDRDDAYGTRKRSRSRSPSDRSTKRTKEEEPYLVLRCLIDTRDAAVVIGRGGENVARIRQNAGTKINVSNSIPGNPERVVTISGTLDAVSKAYGLLVRTLNDEDFNTPSVPGSKAVTLRFTVPDMKMGFVIGRSGAKIKDIQEASGAKLSTSDHILPGSTERVLSIDGVADAIHIAVYHVGAILADETAVPSRERGRRRPSYSSSYGPPSTSHQGYSSAPSYTSALPSGGGGGYIAPPSADTTSQKIYVPNHLVGGLIGKGGSKINEIRYLSQCSVKILERGEMDQGAAPDERLVVITGAPVGIQLAIQLLSERIEKEKERDSYYRGGARPRSPMGDEEYRRAPTPPL